MTYHVDSEVGQLKQVVLHRPGLELSRLTPQNVDDLLFDDVMWAQRAREEHDAFAQKLRDKGVHVHYFGELLAEVARHPGGPRVRPRAAGQREHRRPAAAEAAARARATRSRARCSRSTSSAASSSATCSCPRGRRLLLGVPRRRRLRPHPAAQPPLPAGQHRLRLRRPVGQPDGQAGPRARDHPQPGHLELPPVVPRRRPALLLRQRRRAPPAGDRRGRRRPRASATAP